LFTLAASFYRGYGVNDNYYAISQWLVTYEPGLIKRALLGTLVQLEALSKLTGYLVPTLFFWISNFVLCLLYLLSGLILLRMARLNRSAIFFIPYFLVGPLLRTQSVYIGYTDQVVMILAMAVTYFLVNEKKTIVMVLVSLGALVHETLFVLSAPIILYWGLMQYFSSHDPEKKIMTLKKAAMMLAAPIVVFLSLIAFQEFFLPKEHILSYLNDMLSRQNPPYYRIDMISEIYTFTFMDWYLMHKDEALFRLTAWGGINGYFYGIFFVAVALHAVYILAEKDITYKPLVLFLAIFLIVSPLALHLLVVDHDRVWNHVTWISFLSIWVFLEKFGAGLKTSGSLAFLFFIFTFAAIFFPQARSDINPGIILLLYMPIMVWYLIWMIGHLSPHHRYLNGEIAVKMPPLL